MTKNVSPILVLLSAAVVISFSSVFVKLCNVAPGVSAFYRVFFGSIFLVFACILKKEFTKRKLKNNLLAVVCGLLFALDLWTWHTSIKYVGPGLATILGNCQVFILTLAGFLVYKEKIGLAFLIAVPLAFFGLFLLIGFDIDQFSPEYSTGVVCGLLTAFFYSLFLLLLRKIQSDKDDFSLFYYLMVLSASCALFLGGGSLAAGEKFSIPNLTTLLSLLGLGFFIQFAAWAGISNSLPRVKASHAGLALLLQPALSFVWDVVLFERQTGAAGWIGLVIVLSAIYLGMSRSGENE